MIVRRFARSLSTLPQEMSYNGLVYKGSPVDAKAETYITSDVRQTVKIRMEVSGNIIIGFTKYACNVWLRTQCQVVSRLAPSTVW